MTGKKPNPIRKTTEKARRQAKSLIRSARYGALAVLDPQTGAPYVSRVATATDINGAPIILISTLSAHTGALAADSRCALLLGEPGAGDPLAHPRITVSCTARTLQRGEEERERAAARYLRRHPDAELYADFGDFSFVRLEPVFAAMNAGFGKAYELTAGDVLTASPANPGLAELEPSAVEHMNKDHTEALALCARHYAGASDDGWHMIGIDADGFDLAQGDSVLRIVYPAPLQRPEDLRQVLTAMTEEARGNRDNG